MPFLNIKEMSLNRVLTGSLIANYHCSWITLNACSLDHLENYKLRSIKKFNDTSVMQFQQPNLCVGLTIDNQLNCELIVDNLLEKS